MKTYEPLSITQDLLNFIDASPTPFHAVLNLQEILKVYQFSELKESEKWDLKQNGRYFVTKNDSSLAAFVVGNRPAQKSSFKIIGAHTDSPNLKVKPKPDKIFKNFHQLGVEVYGGVLLSTWFDRDLSLAGRVHFENKKGALQSALVDFKSAVAIIPSLAIHLNRTVNENQSINPQKELPPILLQIQDKNNDFRNILASKLSKDGYPVSKILDFELSFYDKNPPAFVGLHDDFIASARLDNLLSCFVAIKGLIASLDNKTAATKVMICQDHEEVGSCSHIGAEGPFLPSILERICFDRESFHQSIKNSIMISSDNAHGVHPNYAEKYDENHGPILNAGPVIKINANQRYATNSETASLFAKLCEDLKVPYQRFVVRADMGCGSTIGPLTSANVGLKVVDVGVPTFAMHSIRELCGGKDSVFLAEVFKSFYSREDL